jgi:hypothetical protein
MLGADDLLLHSVVDWIDTGIYMGPLAMSLAIIGLAAAARHGLAGRPDLMALVLTGAAVLWLASGPNAAPSAWDTLRTLPVFSSLRHPTRLLVYVFVVLSLLAGAGLDWLRTRKWAGAGMPMLRNALTALVLAWITLDVHPPCRAALQAAFIEPERASLVPAGPPGFRTVRVERPPDSTYYGVPVAAAARAGVAVANGYGVVPIRPSTTVEGDPNHRGEAFLLEPDAGVVRGLHVGARYIEVELETSRPATVIVNQNHAAGWKALDADAEVQRAEDGRLAVRTGPRSGTLVLRYTPPGLWTGLSLGLIGVALAVLLVRARSKSDLPCAQESAQFRAA